MRGKVFAIFVLVFMIASSLFLDSMDAKITEQEQAWQESVQAVQLEQENIQSRIQELKGQYEKLEDYYIAQGIWLYDIRNRMHFEWMDELEWEMNQE